jgi:hypothetical protein
MIVADLAYKANLENDQKKVGYFANKRGDLSVDKEKAVLRLLNRNVIIEGGVFARRMWSLVR